MTRSDARKVELDPLVYMDAQNISFKNGAQSKVTTTSYGKTHTATMRVTLGHTPRVAISYFENASTEREQVVYLTHTPCNFGGMRWWLLCPTCSRRVRKLYLLKDYRCSRCHNLTYRSRKRNAHSQLYSSQRDLDRYERATKLSRHLRTIRYRGQPTKRYRKIVELLGLDI